MQYVPGFVWEILSTGAVAATLVCLFSFLFKGQIGHWLNKDIERLKNQFQSELEAEKSSHLQALEAYKVTLIAEAERKRAEQLVATSAAVKFSEHRFTAINELNHALAKMGIQALWLYDRIIGGLGQGDSYENWVEVRKKEYRERCKVLNDAIASAAIFMKEGETAKLESFGSFVNGVVALGEIEFLELIGRDVEDFDTAHLQEFISCQDHKARAAHIEAKQKEVDGLVRSYALSILKMQ